MTQADLFKNYVDANNLYVNYATDYIWIESGGNKIGKKALSVEVEGEEPLKWKLHARYAHEFHSHTLTVATSTPNEFYVMGGAKNNMLHYKDAKMDVKANMPEKSFFTAVYLNDKIYVFGGFDIYDKIQLKT
jgi:hypothetical protein